MKQSTREVTGTRKVLSDLRTQASEILFNIISVSVQMRFYE